MENYLITASADFSLDEVTDSLFERAESVCFHRPHSTNNRSARWLATGVRGRALVSKHGATKNEAAQSLLERLESMA